MKTLSIDIETYSSANLSKTGVYKYAESQDFSVLLFAYSVDSGPVQVIDLANGEEIPSPILQALTDDSIQKWAFNANFERVCLSRYLGYPTGQYLNPQSWYCSMIWSATLGLPLSLEKVGEVLGLQDQKLKEGKNLIRYFCVPCKPTKSNGGRTRNLPHHALDDWERFKKYNQRDVEVERAIKDRLSKFPVSDREWAHYHHDQMINDLGIKVDLDFVEGTLYCDREARAVHLEEAKELTGLENPNSPMQLKDWLNKQGCLIESLAKKDVQEALETASGRVKRVLELRQELSKSSVKKYDAMKHVTGSDGRARGLIQFYGANRTGRYSGRLVQVQNLPRNYITNLESARNLVKAKDYQTLEMLFDSTPNTLSELIRTAFIPEEDHRFIVDDFSSIEARVLAWLAGEDWRQGAFQAGKDIYCESASQMFGVPVEKHGIYGHLRQKGKVAELACIAEGELVLTDQGLIPIQNIQPYHQLWDGNQWVSHEGVIFKDVKEVIYYDGLTATPDHLVWVQGQPKPIPFGEAMSNQLSLVSTGNSPTAKKRSICRSRVYDIQNAGPHHRFTVSGKLVHNCGYGGSIGALKAMGALEMGLEEDELQGIVDDWRQASPNIVNLWWSVDRCVKDTIKGRMATETHGIRFSYESGILFIQLPSGRRLAYCKPRIGENRFGGESVIYEGIGTGNKWQAIESYGAKFVENIVQGIARDILAETMYRLRDYRIVMHVHDEVILEVPEGQSSVAEISKLMSQPSDWAEGLVLGADGFECQFYQKD